MIRGDGGLATSLQAYGLPTNTPVDGWIESHPDRILALQRSFVEVGAQRILAPTFRLLPQTNERWESLAPAAVALSRRAGADEVWASFGPPSTITHLWDGGPAYGPVLQRIGAKIDGVLLETFVDPQIAAAAVREVRSVFDGPLAVTLVPGHDGRSLGGHPFALEPLLDEGADQVGFNCATPSAVLAAARAADRSGLWLKPAWAPGDLHGTELAAHAAVLGGCCGFDPQRLRTLFGSL